MKLNIPNPPRRFLMYRFEDISGVSGEGPVAEGVLWPDGPVTVRWRGDYPTTTTHDRGIESIEAINGHKGATQIFFLDNEEEVIIDIKRK